MQTPIESPRAPNKKVVLQLPSNSPRTNVAHKSKPYQGNESPQQSGLPIIPNASSGKVQLFRDLASPTHKQLEDKYSFKHLSSSLADIRASLETKDNTPSPMSPNKKGNSPKVNTKSVQEYYAKDEIKGPFESSPKRLGYEKPRVPGKTQKTVGTKTRHNRVLAETRSLSPVASATILGLKDEVREDSGASPTMSNPFKVSYVEPKSATYKRDFKQYPIPENTPFIKNNDFYTQQHSGYVVNMDSTMKNAYKPWMAANYVRQEGPKDTLKPEQNTFFGRTNYNSEYLNFDSHRTIIEKSPRHLTTFADLAFAGKSSYRDTFNSSPEQREFVSRWFNKKDHSPFPAVSVPTQTTYSTIYKPFKIGNGTGSDKPADYVSTQSFPNQYQSTYSRQFDTKSELSRAFIEGSVPTLSTRNIKA